MKTLIIFLSYITLMSQQLQANETCAICLCNIEGDAKTLECHHIFHSDCIEYCLSVNPICPMCGRPSKEEIKRYVNRLYFRHSCEMTILQRIQDEQRQGTRTFEKQVLIQKQREERDQLRESHKQEIDRLKDLLEQDYD
ncbi:RING finger domain-containing protein [Sansalvadorimonas verongulae]|uniref:RING finger domain-containing protein n=1 Tax=Sansalvadorimonas verongulae TaxID=2172824 RepID=UPI0012BB4E8F|nr:RING finger domain-containing protein [Sansalvadorimonas verongulae]MTI14464.1 hypothetical protein [Sansalvadorimonas verongulae]